MSSYVIPVFPAASRVPPRDALAARLAELAGRFAELSSELAAINSAVASVSGKADKAAPAAAGNLASLDASGNLLDSGATPASITAAAVAEIVAGADATMDTLKEIADILGSSQQSGTVLKRISDLESGKADSSSLARVATSGSYDDLSGTPAIPAVDAALATRGAAADAKAVGDALRSGLTEWVVEPSGYSVEWNEVNSFWQFCDEFGEPVATADQPNRTNPLAETVASVESGLTATRHLITPTKTSQLTNDGDGSYAFVKTNDTRLSDARTPTAHHATHAANGSDPIAPADIGAASAADLPYRLVEPGKWEFSPATYNGHQITTAWEDYGAGSFGWVIKSNGATLACSSFDEDALSFDFDIGDVTYYATRPSPPGHLLDRAVNAVSVIDATTLALPKKIDGKSRDFYVRLTVGAESAVTFAATDSGGAAVSWDSMGSPSGTFAAGTYLYRFTEVAAGVFHAADVTNGGSVDPAVLDGKLEATSAAPAFDPTLTYLVGEYVTYGGILYRCKIAVTVAGPWTGDSNWVDVDMTSPDATLDVRSDGRLAVVAADSEILWIQGYDMASASDVVLSCEKVNLLKFSATTAEAFDSTSAYAVGDRVVYGGMVYKFTAAHSAGDWIGTDAAVDSVSLTMPTAPSGKVGDFVLDVDNSANASVKMVADLSGLFTSFDVFVDKGRNLSDLLTFDGGEQCELYFTTTAFGTQAKPAWKVVKQVVEKQEAGS